VPTVSDDHIMMLAITAAEAALVKHVDPGDRSCHRTLDTIVGILDHGEVAQATLNKLHRMLTTRQGLVERHQMS
jgi:hypothetical protein